ncbi:hypothetical protein XACM_2598 [Xanthomonas euvesicatoria pv. citrumelo F1]|nr:hypothetical protein XACM_2598 [Xanthomonas euvesicatoria pv. citrumelo F1]
MVQRLEWFQDRQRRLPLTPKATPRKSSCSFGMCQFGSALLESRPSCAFISARLPACPPARLPACLRVAYRLAMLKHVARIWMLAVFGQNVPSQVRGDAESCRAICLICTFRTMRDAMGVSPPRWTNSQCRSLPPKRTESASGVGNKCSVRLFCGSARPTAAQLADTAFTITRLALASPPR